MRSEINKFVDFLTDAVAHYEKTAPTVSEWLDGLYIRVNSKADEVRLSEILAAEDLLSSSGEWEQPNFAANRIYKLQNRLGQDTTGHAGF